MNKRKAVIIALVLAGIAVIALGAVFVLSWMNGSGWTGDAAGQAFAGRTAYRSFDRRGYFGHMGMGYGFAWIPIAGLVILVALIARFGRRHRHFNGHGLGGNHGDINRPEDHDSAREILRRRFAMGEVPEAEYREKLAVLDQG